LNGLRALLCIACLGTAVSIAPGTGDDDSADIQLGMTRQEIADFLGMTIEVSRSFTELQRRGIVMIDSKSTCASATSAGCVA
jgi:CRP-like cAMP-binding protein